MDASLLSLFMPVFLVALVHMIKPGPYIMAITSLAVSGKWKSILTFWLSYVTAGTLSYLLLLGGLSAIPQGYGMIFIFIKSIAAILFITIGFNNLNKDLNIDPAAIEATKEKITKTALLQTIGAASFMALSNPFDIVLIVGVIPAMTDSTSFTLAEILFIRLTTLLANITVLVSYCVPLFLLRKKLTPSVLKKIRYVASFAMIGIGVYIFINMLTQWDLYKTGLLSS